MYRIANTKPIYTQPKLKINEIIMFKKTFSSILLITVFLSFDNQTKAMQESDLESTSEKTEELQRNTLFCKYCEHEPCNILTLKFLAAAKYCEILKTNGINIYALDSNNADHKRQVLDVMSQELIEYCQQSPMLHLIHKHIAFLEQFKKYKDENKITDENLNGYNKLLLNLATKLDIHDINIETILSTLEKQFDDGHIITLKNINVVLKLLTSPSKQYINLPPFGKEVDITLILRLIWYYKFTDLLKLLAKNRKILPPLNQRILISGQLDETFFMFLVTNSDIKLLKSIINEDKNKDYDWELLFNMPTGKGRTVFHHATKASKDIFEFILELIKEKGLELNNFINAPTWEHLTPLMIAAKKCNYEIVKLLIDHGADINISNRAAKGKIALDYAIRRKEQLLRKDNIDTEILEKADRCIELLTPNQPIPKKIDKCSEIPHPKQPTSKTCILQ